MNKLTRIASLLALSAVACFAQLNTLGSTTVTAAITNGATRFAVGSVTNMTVASATAGTAGSGVYIYDSPGGPGEFAIVTSIDATNLIIGVRRGMSGTKATSHVAGAYMLFGPQNLFKSVDAQGSCVTATVEETPRVNVLTGGQQLCSSILLAWVPSWNNSLVPGNSGVTTAVASAAGVIVPSGPLFHVTGALAVTGFTLPLGFVGGSFTIIPDGAFTTTNAGNIAIASTAVVSKALTFTYDSKTAKFYPSY